MFIHLKCFSSYLYDWIVVFVKLKVKNRFTGITSTTLAEVINLSIVNKQTTVARAAVQCIVIGPVCGFVCVFVVGLLP